MILVEHKHLPIKGVEFFKFGTYKDLRGYFCETFNITQFTLKLKIRQCNESHSMTNVMRGLHIQSNMAKMVRVIDGEMVDMVLDLRIGSKTYKKLLLVLMQPQEWIYIPKGCAHGNFFTRESTIEYMCDNVYNPKLEKTISLLSKFDFIDSTCIGLFETVLKNAIMTDKDRNGINLEVW